ncbi:hypothetical protein EYC84_001744 [Monilinia fructicola]|uniref:Uncharacterized protein n=1 Tax=Monilinia fructicola TaxID=38448 RepID=A0A5M9JQK5_MONFR|nr:hypothetical protein EYC84_001744 [Monilinia fructicola]
MLDRYRDEEDNDFFGDGEATIKVAKKRNALSVLPEKPTETEEDFEQDLQLPSDGALKLTTRSLDSYAMSPSIASSMTAESEDEGLDGLVLPSGPLNFDDILKRRQQNDWPERRVEIGDGDVFDSKKLTLNRNIKVTVAKQQSPTRPKPSVFTNLHK